MYENINHRDRKKIMTKSQIHTVGKKLFLEKGFDNVTVVEIAKASGVSVKTIFTYFDSKEDIVFTNLDGFTNKLINIINTWNKNENFSLHLKTVLYETILLDKNYLFFKEEFRTLIIYDKGRKIIKKLLLKWHSIEMSLITAFQKKLTLDENNPSIYIMANAMLLPFRLFINFGYKNKRSINLYNDDDKKWMDKVFSAIDASIKTLEKET